MYNVGLTDSVGDTTSQFIISIKWELKSVTLNIIVSVALHRFMVNPSQVSPRTVFGTCDANSNEWYS
jgi:hypothetical protein